MLLYHNILCILSLTTEESTMPSLATLYRHASKYNRKKDLQSVDRMLFYRTYRCCRVKLRQSDNQPYIVPMRHADDTPFISSIIDCLEARENA